MGIKILILKLDEFEPSLFAFIEEAKIQGYSNMDKDETYVKVSFQDGEMIPAQRRRSDDLVRVLASLALGTIIALITK